MSQDYLRSKGLVSKNFHNSLGTLERSGQKIFVILIELLEMDGQWKNSAEERAQHFDQQLPLSDLVGAMATVKRSGGCDLRVA
jgi:hypothetical protein